ncbi:hypothetical protein SUGI_0510010 [Cryptomeria japonica]|uniref:probable glutamate carboxypeptidase LAMP1 n=1 Tax=Cryptomeria japonica TaxID=3369 RepID=UPI002408D447|nr:probable glutamate carboxypeptidase LAMP1 [Cryptomeria japonica]GLJ26434.1 hypothetical protein SUGI_0510010 [Cryptomeria japonica]
MEQLQYLYHGGPLMSSGDDSLERVRMIHLNVDESAELQTSLLQLRFKKGALIKAFLNSAFLLVAVVLIGLFVSSMNLTSWRGHDIRGRREEFHHHFLKMGSNASIAMHLQKLTAEPHVAGTPENFATAEYVLSSFRKYGLTSYYRDYNVLLSYPVSRSLVLSLPGEQSRHLKLREREEKGDPFSRSSKTIPGFHAYSPSGQAAALVVYVNYGRVEDFAKLKELGINVSGCIAIARQGMIFRGDIVKNAAGAGAVAVVMYSDPQEYAGGKKSGGVSYPNSKWLPSSGIQRGTVLEGSGDPLSPGWPSTANSERLSANEIEALLPPIPSLPISAEDAFLVMGSLAGPLAPPHWQGALDLPLYRLGPGPAILNLTYVANQTVAPIRNVFAEIKGVDEPDRYVLLGNHRDAWTFGAVDPNSGTAALLDIAQRFGKLLKQGWRPRRTIILCSWDAEEYGSIGSTEWVEQNFDLLHSRAVAYINVDCAVAGPGFFAFATPQLDNLVEDATRKVPDPEDASRTVYQAWGLSGLQSETRIGRLGGGGSDFVSFLHHVGVPAVDIYFGKDYPVYHSLYDNYMWMQIFGDPLFQRHVAVAAIWGLVSLKLVDEEILPFNYEKYADELESYTVGLESGLKAIGSPSDVTVSPLYQSISQLRMAIAGSKKEQKELEDLTPQLNYQYVVSRRREFNDRLLMAERAFTQSDGLPGRPWYKHLIYGPTSHDDYGSSSFPGVSDSLQKAVSFNTSENWSTVQRQIWRVSRAIERVAIVLKGQLT